MNKILACLLFSFALSLSAAAQTDSTPKAPSAPWVVKPETAHWIQTPPADSAAAGKNGIVRTEYWQRGNDYKQEATYANGRKVTLITTRGYGIYTDSEQKEGSMSYLSALNSDASEEQKFANGYVNIFQMLAWVSDKTYARAGTLKNKRVYIYEKATGPTRDEPSASRCTAWIDCETLFPVACAFGNRVYSFDNLETNIAIPDSTFAIPDLVLPQWEEHQKELAKQERLRRINSGSR